MSSTPWFCVQENKRALIVILSSDKPPNCRSVPGKWLLVEVRPDSATDFTCPQSLLIRHPNSLVACLSLGQHRNQKVFQCRVG